MWILLACTSPDPTDTPDDSEATTVDSPVDSEDPCDAEEICNNADDDCDGSVDEGTQLTGYADADSDGFGDPDVAETACELPEGYVSDNTDCDDENEAVHPDAEEICNDSIDNNCDESGEPCGWSETATVEHASIVITGEAETGFAETAVLAPGALVVGSPSYDGMGRFSVFATDLRGELSTDDAHFSVTSTQAGELFASSLASMGDLDGDGSPTIAAGAPGRSGSEGAVYLVELSGVGDVETNWAEAVVSGSAGQSQAGTALASADFDGDGTPDLAVGAPRFGTGTDRKGAAYILHGPISTTGLASSDARLQGTNGARAGQSLAAGDVTGDGIGDLLVGAYWDSTQAEKAGAVYIVEGPAEGNEDLADMAGQLLGPHNAAMAGTTVVALGDANGDGYGDVAVGIPGMDRDADVDVGAVVMVYGPVTSTGQLGDFGRIEGASAYDAVGSILGQSDGALLIGGTGAWVQLGPWTSNQTVESASVELEATPTSLAGGAYNNDTQRDVVVGEAGRVWVVFGEGL